MSQSKSSTLKPIENVLESLSVSSSPQFQENTTPFTETFAFKIIILLFVVLVGIIG